MRILHGVDELRDGGVRARLGENGKKQSTTTTEITYPSKVLNDVNYEKRRIQRVEKYNGKHNMVAIEDDVQASDSYDTQRQFKDQEEKGKKPTTVSSTSSTDSTTEAKRRNTCPAANCYSQIRGALADSLPITINYCDNILCPKKLSQFESIHLTACQHELCTTCLEESLQRQPPACIVQNCNQSIAEVEDTSYFCDDCGKQITDQKTLITTNCCKCHICEECVENRTKMKLLNKEKLICTDGKCLLKKKKIENEEVQVKCKVKDDCEHTALNGFPSNSECNHDVCIECLTEMISDCEVNGVAPMCPQPLCHQYYTIESVNALRTLFPQKAEFFQRFDLTERNTEFICKDDSVTDGDEIIEILGENGETIRNDETALLGFTEYTSDECNRLLFN
uniref:Bm10590 n=1 Tax=Brugia malayi TaxID=6279 RepID=A0A1I9GEA7_BRUMA|nr:Bm10590 [Brugia malayi]